MFLGIEFLPKKLFHELRQINCLSIDKKKWSIKNENQMLYHGFRGLEAKVHHKILKLNSKLWCKCTKIFHFNGLLSNQLPAPKALPPDGTRWGWRGESHHLGRQKYKLSIEMAKVLKRGEFWEIINPKKMGCFALETSIKAMAVDLRPFCPNNHGKSAMELGSGKVKWVGMLSIEKALPPP